MFKRARDEAFWDFSLRTYRSDGVADACIALQDEHGVDVNVVLYCCWAGSRAPALDEAAFDPILRFSREWSGHVVGPLREARRWMKRSGCEDTPVDTGACLALREQIKAIELGAEKLQQLALAESPLPDGDAAGLPGAAANLQRYFTALEVTVDAGVRERMLVVARAAFPKAKGKALQAFEAAL